MMPPANHVLFTVEGLIVIALLFGVLFCLAMFRK